MNRFEIGSDFEAVSDKWMRGDSSAVPWRTAGEQITYLESGRQALRLVSRALRTQGYTTLFFPSHYCESMLGPFRADGWSVQLVRVLDDWTMDPADLHEEDAGRSVVFNMPFFGVGESPAWLQALGEMDRLGAVVVSDETHRVWSAGPRLARFRVASLRKLLPLPDGAYVTGDVPAPARAVSASAEQRLIAMRTKRAYLSGAPSTDHRSAFGSAERMLEGRAEPSKMSEYSSALVKRLDYRRMVSQRQENHAVLSAGWPEEAGTITTGGAVVPSHCVVRHPDIYSLRRFLAEHKVFPPVHWPEPPFGWPRVGSWKSDCLSLPIDHRYTERHMTRIIDVAMQYVRKGR